jgi:hypothetical protein
MQLCGRALYNLLRKNASTPPASPPEEWQIADYRVLTDKKIFQFLSQLGVTIDLPLFLKRAAACDGPEELTEMIFPDPGAERDRGYLLLFELWRRKLPERATFSIFCDELDHLIDLFEQQEPNIHLHLEIALETLEKILDESVDAGLEPKEAFSLACKFCAHDLESFLYDYSAELIRGDKQLDPSKWIDGFYDYINETRWFDFLRTQLLLQVDAVGSNDTLARIIDSLREEPDLDLSLEIATYLIHEGDPLLFRNIALFCLDQLETEEDFQDLLAIVADYYRCLDDEEHEEVITAIFQQRASRESTALISLFDPDRRYVAELMHAADPA